MSADETVYGLAKPGDFNDPEAWGYCKYCAFMVAKDLTGPRLFEHEHMDSGWIKRPCCGGGEESSEAPGLEAAPVTKPSPEEVIVDEVDYPPPERDE